LLIQHLHLLYAGYDRFELAKILTILPNLSVLDLRIDDTARMRTTRNLREQLVRQEDLVRKVGAVTPSERTRLVGAFLFRRHEMCGRLRLWRGC
jgi:hypothetical protein